MSPVAKIRRSYRLFDPKKKEPFRLSRSKIELFLQCPCCFYLDRRLGVARPPSFPFNLNNAVDTLLKKEFDIHRARGSRHPLMKAYGVKAVPFQHERMEEWRDALRRGVTYLHPSTNFLVTGGVDDLWIGEDDALIVVDYKATSKEGEVGINADWQMSYKRQMEIYQWLLRRNDFEVSSIGYFVYCNGKTDRKAFDGKLEFDIKLVPYEGNDAWIEPTLEKIHTCLKSKKVPEPAEACEYCHYRESVHRVTRQQEMSF